MAQNNRHAQSSFPALMSGRGLDVVKIVAALCMLVDHSGYILHVGGLASYLIGRVAFPLFCFAAAAAIVRLRDDTAHLYRQAVLLLLFALITEPVSQITRAGYEVINVLFTLALAMAVAPVMLKLPAWGRAAIYVLAIAAFAFPNAWEFGFVGMMLPVAFALALMGRKLDMVMAAVLAGMVNFGGYAGIDVVHGHLAMAAVIFATLVPLAVLYAINAYYLQRPHAGRILSRYALHVFYPAHMLVLWLIAVLFAQ